MVENAYVIEAARGVTASMVSRGEKPSVISAIMKYQTTERLRRALNDAMDLHGGRAICDGPSNYVQSAYQVMPVGITVEGANILTRSLITFAQGALRSHPYLYKEIQACQDVDEERGLAAFDKAFTGHVAFALSNVFGASSTTSRWDISGMFRKKPTARPNGIASLALSSRNFAFVADLTVAVARRRPQDQAEDHRPSRRRTFRALHALVRAEALRGRRQAGQRPPHRGLRGPERPVPLPEALRGTIDNFPSRRALGSCGWRCSRSAAH